jgi:hypothetical protein
LLLLVLCDLAEEGKIQTPTLQRNGDLAFRFSSYYRVVATRRGTRPDVRLPFFHLRRERLWTALEPDGRVAEDRARTVAAQLDPSFLSCLQDPGFRLEARRTLIARYFEPQERAELYSLVGLPVPTEDAATADAIRYLPSTEN